ncbi:MAG: DUF899 family protein, partial [Myxococcota bacterium]
MTTSNAPVSREQWLAARRALLKEEKALTLRLDALAEKRRALPPVEITAPYAFNEDGRALALRDRRKRATLFGQGVEPEGESLFLLQQG